MADIDVRFEMAKTAQRMLELAMSHSTFPKGSHAVVIVTDPTGKFVGVAGSGGDEYTDAMLRCALGVMHGDEKVWVADEPEVLEDKHGD